MGKISNYGTKTSTDGADTLIIVDSDDSSNKKVTLSNLLPDGSVDYAAIDSTFLSGWITETATWTYASGTGTNVGTFTVSGDYTSIYNVGDRLKFTQTTVKYAIVTKVAYSAPNTTVTIYMGTDYTIANASITSPYYSHGKSPSGFPLDPTKWTETTTDTARQTKSSPSADTWYNQGSLSITLPIGAWHTYYECGIYTVKGSATGIWSLVTLSTANNSVSDNSLTVIQYDVGSTERMEVCCRHKYITVTSATPYYLNIYTHRASTTSVAIAGDIVTTKIYAVCAYL